MRFLRTLLCATAAASAVSARRAWFGDSDQFAIQDDDLSVPGDNPISHCAKPDGDILNISKVDLDPNPPKPGQVLTVTASGHFNQSIEAGAKVHLQVKYGLIRLINQDADLCETSQKIDLACPIEKGDTKISKEIDIPKEIPPGKYTVIADVITKDGDKITCLTATVTFGKDAKLL